MHYFEWDVLQILKNTTLKEICIKHASIDKDGVRGEAKIKKHIRKHINYSEGGTVQIVRIDLLQCIVTFIDDKKGAISNKSIYYLAEGSQAHYTFKLNLYKKNFYLVGEIYCDKWISWFSKENIQLSSTEGTDEDVLDKEKLGGTLGHVIMQEEEVEVEEEEAEAEKEENILGMELVRSIEKKDIDLKNVNRVMEEIVFPGKNVKTTQQEREEKVGGIQKKEGKKVKEIEEVENMKAEEVQIEKNIKAVETPQETEIKTEGTQSKGDLKKDEIEMEGFIKETMIQQKEKF